MYVKIIELNEIKYTYIKIIDLNKKIYTYIKSTELNEIKCMEHKLI